VSLCLCFSVPFVPALFLNDCRVKINNGYNFENNGYNMKIMAIILFKQVLDCGKKVLPLQVKCKE
jgi:hypothetical protein